eukprot:1338919-Ditylum_brightwellii.AAC.1
MEKSRQNKHLNCNKDDDVDNGVDNCDDDNVKDGKMNSDDNGGTVLTSTSQISHKQLIVV